jgi:hypothetical protein
LENKQGNTPRPTTGIKIAVASLVFSCCTTALWIFAFAIVLRGEVTPLSDTFALTVVICTLISSFVALVVVNMKIPKVLNVMVGIAGAMPPVVLILMFFSNWQRWY